MKKIVILFAFMAFCQIIFGQSNEKITIKCQEKDSVMEGSPEPAKIKICKRQSYENKTVGIPDDKGRLFYTCSVSKNGKIIKNQLMFNQKQNELLAKINAQIRAEFERLKKVDADCFNGVKLKNMTMNDLQIEFTENKMLFHYMFGLPGACLSLDGGTAKIDWSEADKYILK